MDISKLRSCFGWMLVFQSYVENISFSFLSIISWSHRYPRRCSTGSNQDRGDRLRSGNTAGPFTCDMPIKRKEVNKSRHSKKDVRLNSYQGGNEIAEILRTSHVDSPFVQSFSSAKCPSEGYLKVSWVGNPLANRHHSVDNTRISDVDSTAIIWAQSWT